MRQKCEFSAYNPCYNDIVDVGRWNLVRSFVIPSFLIFGASGIRASTRIVF